VLVCMWCLQCTKQDNFTIPQRLDWEMRAPICRANVQAPHTSRHIYKYIYPMQGSTPCHTCTRHHIRYTSSIFFSRQGSTPCHKRTHPLTGHRSSGMSIKARQHLAIRHHSKQGSKPCRTRTHHHTGHMSSNIHIKARQHLAIRHHSSKPASLAARALTITPGT